MAKLGPFLLGSIALLVKQYAEQYRAADLNKTLHELAHDLSLPRIETFDFIVVGGGTAGCLVASRLSQFFTVLLLETGGNPVPAESNSFLIRHVRANTDINYVIPVVRQEHFSLSTGGMAILSQGRMMGGSGSHNDNNYNRGSPHDYDYFAKLTGDPSWSYRRIVEHFKMFENFVGWLIDEREREVYYRTGGPLNVITDLPSYLGPWLQAGRELGYAVKDPNGFQTESFTPMAQSVRDGKRESTYTAFIEGIESTRNNLRVLRYSQVQEILINDYKVAYGVTYLRHGIPQIAHASREVILSAGAILSPIVLMKSGIGPADTLEKAGIPLKLDLPGVGNGLVEHPLVPLIFNATNLPAAEGLFPLVVTEFEIQTELDKFQSFPKTGAFTQTDGPQAFIVSSRAKRDGEGHWPDVQLLYDSNLANMGNTLGFDVPQISIVCALTRPKSRGYVKLNTTAYLAGEKDDSKLAIVNPACLTEQSDMGPIVEGIKIIFKIIEETTPFRGAGLVHVRDSPSACDAFPYRSDKYWECVTVHNTFYYCHYSSTCRMGRADAPWAVVDSKFKVRGIRNLRVVDSSVMPTPTNGNSNAPTCLTAQKGSCDILVEHMYPYLIPLEGSCPLSEYTF